VDGCENLALIHGLCGACYQSEIYWSKKKPAERAERRKHLTKLQSRQSMYSGKPHLYIVKVAAKKNDT
jgi:hypothetical protein